jgi:F-box/leucine-rich repeat protein 4
MSTTNETIIEQIPKSIRDFSSQYGSNNTRSYTVENICSDPEIFPMYGDSTNALVFRTYGPWWINLPSYRENKRQFSRQENEFNSRDFIEIEYADLVCQCTSLSIYETYNPGTLEVVYAGKEENDGSISWHRVWKFPEPFSIILRNGEEFFVNDGKNIFM